MNVLERPPQMRHRAKIHDQAESSLRNTFGVRMWGTRGSVPVSGMPFQHYGGNTVCVEMRCGEHVLLFDAGSGIPPAGFAFKNEGIREINLFFSHSHYDHIIGLPYFKPLYDLESTVKVWSGHLYGQMTTCQMVHEFMRPPWFPVGPGICRANLAYGDFRPGDVLTPYPDTIIKTGNLNHPGGAVGYRVEWGGRVVAMITDTEHVPGVLDPEVLALIENADLFLYDSCYTDDEMATFKGFGHSSWQQAIRLAKAANAKSVAFMHHAPWRTDADINEIGRQAALEFPNAFAAYDGQTIQFRAL
jgi:phosphoribosyl 1,2-cyclic phosphodiesterase